LQIWSEHTSFMTIRYRCGLRQQSLYSDLLCAGRSRDQILVGVRFFAPIQTGPGSHTASYTIGTGSFPRGKAGWVLHCPPTFHLALKLKKEYSYTSTPPLGLHGLF